MSNYNNRLIYGKNQTERIVSIEINNDEATIFRQLEDGSLDIQKASNRFWILASKPFDKHFVKLEGDQTFKYGKQYKDFGAWLAEKKTFPYQEIYTISNPVEALMVKDGYTMYKGLKYDEVSILSSDIETTGLEHNEDSRVILISNTLRKNGVVTKKLFCYDEYDNCAEMIDAWAAWVREVDPSIMIMHNGYFFDIPYLQFCHSRYTDQPIILGRCDKPIRFNQYDSKFRVDGSRELHYRKFSIYGRQFVDTMFLAYKYDIGRKYESYGLKKIIAQEGLEKPGRVFYDASKIKDNYTDPVEFQKIKEYCVDDSDDSLVLYDLMVAPFFYMTQMIPKPFQLMVESASGAQLNSFMVRAYLQDRKSIPKASESVEFEGAISFGEPGVYAEAVSLDIASLYPSVMLQYNIFNKAKDPANYMLQFLDYMRTERLKNKKLAKETGDNLYKHLDGSFKILINSLYGFMGAAGLNFNYPEGAAEVTRMGRETLLKSIDWAKEKGFTVPKGDTDSITIWKNGTAFQKAEINELILDINNKLPEQINFELDEHYDVIVVFKAKNYAYRVGDKVSTKGSAIKASTKCEALKTFIKEVLYSLLYLKNNAEIQDLYNQYVAEITDIKDIKRWSARKTLSSTMQESERTNETRVMDALKGSNYREGDRFYVFRMPDESLCLAENFAGVYDKSSLLKNLYDTIKVFDTVLPVKELFINYSLKKNIKLLDNSTEKAVS